MDIQQLTNRINRPEHDPLTKEREKELAEQLLYAIENNNTEKIKKIQEELINRHLRLVLNIAKNYQQKIEWEDLIAAGILGLTQAVIKWKPEKGNLYNWAQRWITTALTREVDQNRTIRIPERKAREAALVRKEIKEKQNKINRQLSKEEIEDITNGRISFTDLPSVENSLDEPENLYAEDNKKRTILDTTIDLENNPEYIVEREIQIKMIREALNELTDKEKEIIYLRFGFDNTERKTLQEIGEKYNLTGEAMRRVETTAISKLRHPALKNKFIGEE